MVGLVPDVHGKADAVADMLRFIWKEVQSDPLPGMNTLSMNMTKIAAAQAEQAGPSPGTTADQAAGDDHLDVLV